MKKTYQTPTIRIKAITTEGPIALSVGGNTGIGIGEGTPPSTGGSKGNGMNIDEEEQPILFTSPNVWDD